MQHIRYRCTDSAAEFPDRRCSAGSEPSAEENAVHASSAFPLLFCCSHRSIFLAGLRWRDSAHRQSSVLPADCKIRPAVSKYDFAALQEENETTFAESLSSVDADAENIIEALSELVKNNAEAADFVADYLIGKIIWVSLSTSLTMSSSDRSLCSCNGTSVGAMCPSATASSVSPLWAYLPVHGLCILHP